jgi:hypothetical protein
MPPTGTAAEMLMLSPDVLDLGPNMPQAYRNAITDYNRELQPSMPAVPDEEEPVPELEYSPPPIMSFTEFADRHYPQQSNAPFINPYVLKAMGEDWKRYAGSQEAMARQSATGDELMLRREREKTYRDRGLWGGRGLRGGRQSADEMMKQLLLLEMFQKRRGEDPEAPVSAIIKEYRDAWTGKTPDSPKEMLTDMLYKKAMELYPNDPGAAAQWAATQNKALSAGQQEDNGILSAAEQSRLFMGERPDVGDPMERQGGIAQAFQAHGPVGGYLWARQRMDTMGAGFDEKRGQKVEKYIEDRRPTIEQLQEAWSSQQFNDPAYMALLKDVGIISEQEYNEGVTDPLLGGEQVSDELAKLAYYRVLEKCLSPAEFDRLKAYIQGG